jgi:hypothetical protein
MAMLWTDEGHSHWEHLDVGYDADMHLQQHAYVQASGRLAAYFAYDGDKRTWMRAPLRLPLQVLSLSSPNRPCSPTWPLTAAGGRICFGKH